MTDLEALPIAEARRQLTLERIRKATRVLLLERGLDVTMDEIAAAAEVSRRTVFRHFDSRETLLASALEEGILRYGEQLPPFAGDWEAWLRSLCDTIHAMQGGYGRGYWELMYRADLSPELAEVEQARRTQRRRAMARIADKLWREAGGPEPTPVPVRATVSAHLSAQFTAAVLDVDGGTPALAADLAYTAIRAAVRATASPSERA